jgi:glycosyltransferase involved in cell wall biosynthesis
LGYKLKRMKSSVSVIFPMYNEREYIKETIEETKRAIDSMFDDYEIIVIDNNSDDGSFEKLLEFAKINTRIKVFCYDKIRKLGNVFRTGLSKATKEIIVCSDFDLPYDLGILDGLIPLLSDSDIIQGYRVGKRESILRKVYTKVYNFLLRIVFNLEIKDANFNMKIFKRKILDNIKLESEGPFIAAELLIKAKYFGYKIKEVGVKHHPRKYSLSRLCSFNGVLFTTLDIVSEMLKLYPRIRHFQKQNRPTGENRKSY